MSEQETRTDVAKVTHADVGFEDHGIFVLFATFDFGFYSQGLGYAVDLDFIKQFIRACGVERLSQCVGRIVQVTSTSSKILVITPMKFETGTAFDIAAWSDALSTKREQQVAQLVQESGERMARGLEYLAKRDEEGS